MPRKFKRVLRKGYGYSKNKASPAQQHSHRSDFTNKTMCNSSPECTDHEESSVSVRNICIQTDTTFASSNAETQTIVSINPNHFLVDVAIQCVMDDEICEDIIKKVRLKFL